MLYYCCKYGQMYTCICIGLVRWGAILCLRSLLDPQALTVLLMWIDRQTSALRVVAMEMKQKWTTTSVKWGELSESSLTVAISQITGWFVDTWWQSCLWYQPHIAFSLKLICLLNTSRLMVCHVNSLLFMSKLLL